MSSGGSGAVNSSLSNSSSSTPSPSQRKPRQRIKNSELAQYYLQASGPPNAPNTTATTTKETTKKETQILNLDSPSFDPKLYLQKLLSTQSLQDLLKTDTELLKGRNQSIKLFSFPFFFSFFFSLVYYRR